MLFWRRFAENKYVFVSLSLFIDLNDLFPELYLRVNRDKLDYKLMCISLSAGGTVCYDF